MTRDWLIALVMVLAPAAVGCYAGYKLGGAGVQQVRAEHARELVALADANSVALHQALARANRLALDLSAARRIADQLTQERLNATSTVTDGRACLREPALRLLDSAPGLRVELPPAGGGADAGHVATDTHIYRWALAAGARYAECARRLNALIQAPTETPP
ncbi:hypothetical protein [Pseudothauera rhizosphaerae]|uniref:Bacteriophage Rz lysis protein n=1 Tax=Pseudothauera rhizosphaerae TaxID=2565932 RepID=A0A4S4AMR4_9RHOO|nr:hypothetical protein [Pseudothauera rhizosphaerae]THF60922.1 hypothetical protein E6O51_11880 [Pseudothauera rhizosphaerae]